MNGRFARQNRTFRQSQRLTLRCSLSTTEADRPWDLASRQADVGQHKFVLRGRPSGVQPSAEMRWRCSRDAPIRTKSRTRDGATLRSRAALIRREEMFFLLADPIASPFPWRTQTPLACFGEINMKKLSLCATATCFCPSEYRTRAIGLRWFLGPRLRDATRRMRSRLQLHINVSNGVLTHPKPREVQRIRREVRRGSRFGDRSRQMRLGLRQTLHHLWPRDGAATQEMRDAWATGPRNEIDIFTRRKTGVFGPETQTAGFASWTVLRADPCCAAGERYFRGGARSTPRKSNGAALAFFQL
jgi:hypothetical protein